MEWEKEQLLYAIVVDGEVLYLIKNKDEAGVQYEKLKTLNPEKRYVITTFM